MCVKLLMCVYFIFYISFSLCKKISFVHTNVYLALLTSLLFYGFILHKLSNTHACCSKPNSKPFKTVLMFLELLLQSHIAYGIGSELTLVRVPINSHSFSVSLAKSSGPISNWNTYYGTFVLGRSSKFWKIGVRCANFTARFLTLQDENNQQFILWT